MANIKVQGNKLLITRSLGVLAIFGIPLLVSGVLVSLFYNSFGTYWLGIILQLLGVIIAIGRVGVVFNRDTKQIMTWWGIGLPFHSQYQSLDLYNKLILDQKMDAVIGADSYNVYPVQMISEGNRALEPLPIYQSTDLLESRAVAEQIAQHLGKPLYDKSLGHTLMRQPEASKKGLAYRLGLQNQQKYSFYPPKNQSEMMVRETEWGTEINLLPCGFAHSFLAFLPHCIAAVIIAIFIVGNIDAAIIHQSRALIIFISLTFLSLITYLSICTGTSITRIMIDHTTIKVNQYVRFGRSEQVLQIQEMEEIFISGNSDRIIPMMDEQVLSLVSTTQTVEITGIHSSEELDKLKKIIYQAIDFPMQTAEFEVAEKLD